MRLTSEDAEYAQAEGLFLDARLSIIVENACEKEESLSWNTTRLKGFLNGIPSLALQQQTGENATKNLLMKLRNDNIPRSSFTCAVRGQESRDDVKGARS